MYKCITNIILDVLGGKAPNSNIFYNLILLLMSLQSLIRWSVARRKTFLPKIPTFLFYFLSHIYSPPAVFWSVYMLHACSSSCLSRVSTAVTKPLNDKTRRKIWRTLFEETTPKLRILLSYRLHINQTHSVTYLASQPQAKFFPVPKYSLETGRSPSLSTSREMLHLFTPAPVKLAAGIVPNASSGMLGLLQADIGINNPLKLRLGWG